MKSGILIVSLDFELHWGVQSSRSIGEYGSNILGARSVVESMLNMFSEYSIHATWASVGFLFAGNVEEVEKFLPSAGLRPTYGNDDCNSYRCLDWIREDEGLAKYFFAPNLIRKIVGSKHQELASHTFSHYFCKEDGQSLEQFKADADSLSKIGSDLLGVDLRTIIFPRNQSDSRYVGALDDLGMIAYRGEEEDWIHTKMGSSSLMRMLRVLDSYLPLTGSGGYRPYETAEGVVNLKGSRFLRPYHKRLAIFEGLKMRRIKKQMRNAARKGLAFHLWWHPHNFGVRQEYHLKFLREIFEYYQTLSKEFGMRSLNMLEAAREFKETKP